MTFYKPYEFLPHTADIKMRVYGHDMPELFDNALKGMFAVCGPRARMPREATARAIKISSTKPVFLLIEFLAECLCLADTYHEAYERIEVKTMTETLCEAVVHGYKIEFFENTEIKAVTYHGATLECTDDGLWVATVLFDI